MIARNERQGRESHGFDAAEERRMKKPKALSNNCV